MPNITAAIANTVTPGQIVDMGGYAGTVTASRPVPRSKNWSLTLDVGGKPCEFRLPPTSAVTILDALPSTARAADHQPVDTWSRPGPSNGTECTCGWAPTKRATRSSQWNAAYNRHMKSLGLLGL